MHGFCPGSPDQKYQSGATCGNTARDIIAVPNPASDSDALCVAPDDRSGRQVNGLEPSTFSLGRFQHQPSIPVPITGMRFPCSNLRVCGVNTSTRCGAPAMCSAPGVVLVGSFSQVAAGGSPPGGVPPGRASEIASYRGFHGAKSRREGNDPHAGMVPGWGSLCSLMGFTGLTHSRNQ